jgi:hypothetical protein
MDGEFQDIVDSLTEKPPRSCLEPYGELIDELRHRKRTYRDIVDILAKNCRLRVSISTLHDFVRARARRKRHSAGRIATGTRIATPIAPKAKILKSGQNPSDEEVRQRIAAFKARKPVAAPSLNDFHFDPDEPLRLIPREKPELDK